MASLRQHGRHQTVHGQTSGRDDRDQMEGRSVGSGLTALNTYLRRETIPVYRVAFKVILIIENKCALTAETSAGRQGAGGDSHGVRGRNRKSTR